MSKTNGSGGFFSPRENSVTTRVSTVDHIQKRSEVFGKSVNDFFNLSDDD